MPSFELSKLQAVTGARALADTDRTSARPTGDAPAAQPAPSASAAGIKLEVNARIDTAAAPVDSDRVAEIRAALKDGTYPLVPTEIADAIIAAQISFGMDR